MHLPRPLPLAPSSPRAVCGAACPVARRDATDRDRPPAAPTGTIGSPRITSGRNGVRTRPCVAASRCATSKCGSEASRCAHRIEQLYRPRSSSARLSRLNTALPEAEPRAERNVALPERPRMQRARILPTRSQLRRSEVASVFGYLRREERGCSMAAQAAAARPPTRPERPGHLDAAHRSGSREAAARTRHAWMARRAQCRASASWRCPETLGTPSALIPAAWRRERGTGEQCASAVSMRWQAAHGAGKMIRGLRGGESAPNEYTMWRNSSAPKTDCSMHHAEPTLGNV